jgi:hypothetical protein
MISFEMECALHGLDPHGQSLSSWCCPPVVLPQPAPASLLATMHIHVYTYRYRHIHADTGHICRYVQNFVRMHSSLVCKSAVCACIILQYIQHTYTYNGGVNPNVVCMCMYCMYVLFNLVHISCISCICCAYCMHFWNQNLLVRRYRHDTYNTCRYIHICIEIHTSYMHICIAIHTHTCSSHRVFAQCIIMHMSMYCMYRVCIFTCNISIHMCMNFMYCMYVHICCMYSMYWPRQARNAYVYVLYVYSMYLFSILLGTTH